PRKPILPSESEIGVNARSRSAKLRVAHRIAPQGLTERSA
ncbi:MAG: 16S rRNA (cytosine(1402)-N(4))-methyltransferase, partial [Candidatus Puniceispirillaceae bacterium]